MSDTAHRQEALGEALAALVAGLDTPDARASLARDPYWPKWDSPWWHLTLLLETGEIRRVPRRAIVDYARAVRTHYLPHFPIHAHELPVGTDTYRDIACHCALATAYRVIAAWGAPVDQLLPGARPWFVRYALPDGGWNCDEGAYTRAAKRSSVVTTVDVLEALLEAPGELSAEEATALDAGIAYLLERRLFRSLSGGGRPMNPDWLAPIFPRFYDYDVLRGARLVARWGLRRDRPVPLAALADALDALSKWAEGGCRPRAWLAREGSIFPPDGPGRWRFRRPASTFPLLDAVSAPDRPNPWLQREWNGLRADLQALSERKLLLS